jgi:hypothetical protein
MSNSFLSKDWCWKLLIGNELDPSAESGLVGSHLRGDRFYGEVVSLRRPILTVRSEIGPYRRPITVLFRVAKNKGH